MEIPFVVVRKQTDSGPLIVQQFTLQELLEFQRQCTQSMLAALAGDAAAAKLVDEIFADAVDESSQTHPRSLLCMHLLWDVMRQQSAAAVATAQQAAAAAAAAAPAPAPAPVVNAVVCGRDHAPGAPCAECERARFKRPQQQPSKVA
jgi:hypothetical protein